MITALTALIEILDSEKDKCSASKSDEKLSKSILKGYDSMLPMVQIVLLDYSKLI